MIMVDDWVFPVSMYKSLLAPDEQRVRYFRY